MKLFITLTLLLSAAQGFVVLPNKQKVSSTQVLAFALFNKDPPADLSLPIDEMGQKYKAKDGSTILGPSQKLSASIGVMAPLILAINPPGTLFLVSVVFFEHK